MYLLGSTMIVELHQILQQYSYVASGKRYDIGVGPDIGIDRDIHVHWQSNESDCSELVECVAKDRLLRV